MLALVRWRMPGQSASRRLHAGHQHLHDFRQHDRFQRHGAQTIPAFNYNNLTSSNTGARTLANSGSIGIAGVFTPGTNAYTITGSTVISTAARPKRCRTFNYNNLTLNNPNGVTGFRRSYRPGIVCGFIGGSSPVHQYNTCRSMSVPVGGCRG